MAAFEEVRSASSPKKMTLAEEKVYGKPMETMGLPSKY